MITIPPPFVLVVFDSFNVHTEMQLSFIIVYGADYFIFISKGDF